MCAPNASSARAPSGDLIRVLLVVMVLLVFADVRSGGQESQLLRAGAVTGLVALPARLVDACQGRQPWISPRR